MKRAVVLAFLAIVLSACSGPLESADWTIPVPEGTPLHEYAYVAETARATRIRLMEDLVVTSDGADPDRTFYRVRGIAVSRDGNLYVNDAGNHRIQVFDRTGGFLMSLGREGEGPGELIRAASITVAGERVFVADYGNLRLTWWRVDGEFLGAAHAAYPALRLFGLPDGSLAATHRIFEDEAGELQLERAFIQLSSEGEHLREYATLPLPFANTPSVPISLPDVAVGPAASVYVTSSKFYEVVAFGDSGEMRWALRASYPTRAIPPKDIERYEAVRRRRHRESNSESELFEIDWPEQIPALSTIAVDGHGHLYVFPFVYLPIDIENPPSPPEVVPVDVYSPAGAHLFSGSIDSHGLVEGGWDAAHGDLIFRSDFDPDTREPRVVRYRLVEPF